MTLTGLDPAGGDNATFLDDVRLSATTAAPSFGYRADGLRAWKMVGTGAGAIKTYYLYDGPSLVCELSGQSATAVGVTASYTWGVNGLLSQRQTTGAGTSYFYTFDPSGNLAQCLNGGGAVTTNAGYTAFGQPPISANSPFGFSGQWGGYTDAETGLVLITHRYYDIATGRFLTRDPIGYRGGQYS